MGCILVLTADGALILSGPEAVLKDNPHYRVQFAFQGRLSYTRENGFSNPEISLPFKALGGFLCTENGMAHRGGFEPPTP